MPTIPARWTCDAAERLDELSDWCLLRIEFPNTGELQPVDLSELAP